MTKVGQFCRTFVGFAVFDPSRVDCLVDSWFVDCVPIRDLFYDFVWFTATGNFLCIFTRLFVCVRLKY